MPNDSKPFAIGSGTQFVDNMPYLGGWIRVLATGVGASTNVVLTHGLRVIPRVVQVLYAGSNFTAKTAVGATWTRTTATVQFDIAQPAGTVVFLW